MSIRSLGAIVAGALTSAAALAQPAVFTDLGTHTSAEVFSQAVTLTAANDIQWFRIELPANSATDGWVDIWTNTPGDITDSEIGLYDNSGNIVNGAAGGSDDDSGPGLLSQLTYGQTTPARPAIGTGAARNGIDGTLAGGVYWVAVGHFNVTFGLTGWTVTSAYTSTQRTTTLNFDIQPPGSPTTPSGGGTATPNNGLAGASFLASVTVTPGANPPSTGIAVSLDASLVGGGTVSLADQGGNVFTGNVTTSGSATPGAYNLPFTITDGQSRTGNGTLAYTVNAPPPTNDDCGTAQAVGLGSTSFDSTSATTDGLTVSCTTSSRDIWYSYTAPAAGITVDIDTCNAATTFDTVLTVYDACGGAELACDDDSCGTPALASVIADLVIPGNATVYIRVARFGAAAATGGPGVLTITEVLPPPVADWDETVDGGGDAGQTQGTAQTVSGSGTLASISGACTAGDADVYMIEICDPANFRASTRNANTLATDTQLFLFNSSGVGVVMNDDDPDPTYTGLLSTISNAIVGSQPAGNYYLAVSLFDTDPVDAAAADIWLDQPFDTERAPDGAAAANPWDTFNGAATTTGSYWIDLTGACYVGGNPCPCPGDVNGDGIRDISDLGLFLAAFGLPATNCADIDGNGVVDISDLGLFLAGFGVPCP